MINNDRKRIDEKKILISKKYLFTYSKKFLWFNENFFENKILYIQRNKILYIRRIVFSLIQRNNFF